MSIGLIPLSTADAKGIDSGCGSIDCGCISIDCGCTSIDGGCESINGNGGMQNKTKDDWRAKSGEWREKCSWDVKTIKTKGTTQDGPRSSMRSHSKMKNARKLKFSREGV